MSERGVVLWLSVDRRTLPYPRRSLLWLLGSCLPVSHPAALGSLHSRFTLVPFAAQRPLRGEGETEERHEPSAVGMERREKRMRRETRLRWDPKGNAW